MANNIRDLPAVKAGQDWPPTASDAWRLEQYEKHANIVDGQHLVAFQDQSDLDRYKVYVTCNLAGLITRRATDLLFGEELTLQFEDDAPKGKVEALLDWWYDNDVQKVLYEGALDGAALGDAVYLPHRDEEGIVGISPAQVTTWFPQTDPDNLRVVYRHVFAWKRTWMAQDKKQVDFLKMRIHEKGVIYNQLWEMKGGKLVKMWAKGTPPWADLWGDTPEVEETGVEDDFLVVHVPNYRSAREFFGRSDLHTLDSLFSCLNARYSQLDHVLAEHADPILVDLPKGIADPVTGEVDKGRLDYIEQSGDPDEKTPSYVVWEGSPAETLAFIEEITNKILLISETDKALLGMDTGGGPVSGRAMKFALLATLAKVNRKRAYYDKAIPHLLALAQKLMGEKDPIYPTILWPDGLPQDTAELLDETSRRLADRTISRKEAVKRLDNADDMVAQKLLDEIDGEDQNTDEAVRSAVQRERPVIKVEGFGETL